MSEPATNTCQDCMKQGVLRLRPIYIVEKGVMWCCDKCYDMWCPKVALQSQSETKGDKK